MVAALGMYIKAVIDGSYGEFFYYHKEVIFGMESDYILPCVITMVAGVFFTTTLYGLLADKFVHKNVNNDGFS